MASCPFPSWEKHSFEIGTYGLKADVYPAGTDSGPTDSFTDYAFDAQYQLISSSHHLSIQSTWIHEKQNWDASYFQNAVSNSSDTLKTFKIKASYFYKSKYGPIGGYVSYFSTTGDTDPLLYSPGRVNGSRTGSPESKGFILEGDWVFREKYKVAVQYTIYEKFNGADNNYDGFGRNASDNNTFYLAITLMF